MKECSRCYVRWRKRGAAAGTADTGVQKLPEAAVPGEGVHSVQPCEKQEVNSGMNDRRAPIHYCTCSLMEFRRERAYAWPWMFLIRAEQAKEISFWAGIPYQNGRCVD